MIVMYYKDSDGIVVGHTASPGRVDIQKELEAWGPGISALEVSSYTKQPGKIRRVVNGQLIFEDNPVISTKAADRAAGKQELVKLGLTQAQVDALFGG